MSSRRAFLSRSLSAAAVTIVPRSVLGGPGFVAPSARISVACVGVGAQGTRVLMDLLAHPDVQVVAVCDVNKESADYIEWSLNELRDKERALLGGRYSDWGQDWRGPTAGREPARRLVEAYYGAHARSGKYRGCATYLDYRELLESEATRLLCEWIGAGAIGPVREVHNWSSRPFWPQAIERPPEGEPVPATLDWDLWLGPAPSRPYHRAYLPFVWRGWYDFGAGALGDMGCYSFDTIFRALRLGPPESVEAASTKRLPETFPLASVIHFRFPARGDMPPVRLTWWDGGLKPPRPPELEEGREMGRGNEGLLFVGDNGTIMCGFNGSNPRLLPESRMQEFTPPTPTLPTSQGHYCEWLEACKGGPPAGASFEFEGPITEALLLGNVAVRAGQKLQWNPTGMKVLNAPDAQPYVLPEYRPGWAL